MVTHRAIVLGEEVITLPSKTMLHLLEDSVNLVNISTVLLILPILNHVAIPLLDEYTPNMRKRMGIGIFLVIPTALSLALIEGYGYGNVSTTGRILLLTLPAVLMGITKSLLYVASKYNTTDSSLIPYIIDSRIE